MNRSAIVLSLVWVATVSGQAPSAPRTPMSDEVFKNVQVLKGIPVDQFMATMGIFASAVGRGCSECHLLDSAGGNRRSKSHDDDSRDLCCLY